MQDTNTNGFDKTTTDAVMRAVAQIDPMNLIAMELPEAEYSPEVTSIVADLHAALPDPERVYQVVRKVMTRFFNNHVADSQCRQIALLIVNGLPPVPL